MLSLVNHNIDTIVSAKKQAVDTMIVNEELRKPMHTFIDAQSKLAKQVAEGLNTFMNTVAYSLWSADYNKIFATKKGDNK